MQYERHNRRNNSLKFLSYIYEDFRSSSLGFLRLKKSSKQPFQQLNNQWKNENDAKIHDNNILELNCK